MRVCMCLYGCDCWRDALGIGREPFDLPRVSAYVLGEYKNGLRRRQKGSEDTLDVPGMPRWYDQSEDLLPSDAGLPILPSYEEAVNGDGGRDPSVLVRPPPYDSLFGRSGDDDESLCSVPPPDVRVSGDSTLGNVPFRGTVLDSLDREFKWTSVSVGVSIAVLIVLLLVVIIAVFPRRSEY